MIFSMFLFCSTFLMAYLSPTATLVETEILNYDFYDLVRFPT